MSSPLALFATNRSRDAIALLAPGRTPMTFGALYDQIDAVRTSLTTMGIARTDCVAVAMPTGPERLVVQLGAMESCAVAPLNPALLSGEFGRQLAHLKAKALIVAQGGEGVAQAAARTIGVPCILAESVAEGPAGTVRLHGAPFTGTAGTPREPEPDDVVLLMQTSGTTATPKIVPLTLSNMLAGAANVCATLGLGSEDRLLSILQLHHIAGIAYTLASLSAGGSVACTPGYDAESFSQWLRETDPTWFWAAPAMLHEMVRRGAENPARRLRFIRVGSAPLPPALMLQAEVQFGVPVLENYGMTEAAPQIASAPLPPRVRKPGSVGLPVGMEIRIVDEAGNPVPQGTRGEIVIRGDSVMGGYRASGDVHPSAFTHGWFRTGDLGYLDADGYLYLSGRLKEIINRGGEKISPVEVDCALLAHPGVEKAVTYPVPHPTLGEEIAIAVVLRPGFTISEQELQKFAMERLSASKLPRYIRIVSEIPSDDRGKTRRFELAERLGVATGGNAPARQGGSGGEIQQTPVERELIVMWQDVLRVGAGTVGPDAHFLDLGGDSVSAAQIISRVRRTFNVDLSPLAFFEAPTIAGLARIIESKRGVGPVQLAG